jgi:hypothetical protein
MVPGCRTRLTAANRGLKIFPAARCSPVTGQNDLGGESITSRQVLLPVDTGVAATSTRRFVRTAEIEAFSDDSTQN